MILLYSPAGTSGASDQLPLYWDAEDVAACEVNVHVAGFVGMGVGASCCNEEGEGGEGLDEGLELHFVGLGGLEMW